MAIDSRSNFCYDTKTFLSPRPGVDLPPESVPITAAAFAFSLLPSPPPSVPTIIDSTTGITFPLSSFLASVHSLASGLASLLSTHDVAYVLSPPELTVPVIYLSLLSLGVVVSPGNPASTPTEVAHQLKLSKPSLVFTVSSLAHKIPPHFKKLLIDTPEFRSYFSTSNEHALPLVKVKQSDTAAIMYSSGTTGRVKGVAVTHRSIIALLANHYVNRQAALEAARAAGELPPPPTVALLTPPLFHVFGFMMLLRSVSMGETAVFIDRFELGALLRAVERYKVTLLPAAPPVLVALSKSEDALKRDLSSLMVIAVGGAPLGREVAEKFAARFPNVQIVQGYGLTETTGGIAVTVGPEETQVYGSVGKLDAGMEAKIVDTSTGEALGPGERGELWLRGPFIMKGYVGDEEATASTLDHHGWLKTGDLCFFNEDGFLFIVDRLKELIKYNAYQVPPAELEHILQSHPEIGDAAVIPYPDEAAGEIPMAFIVRQPGSTLTEKQVMEFLAKQVAPYKKIRRVAFVSAIPKSPAGKILRRELVTQALSMQVSKL